MSKRWEQAYLFTAHESKNTIPEKTSSGQASKFTSNSGLFNSGLLGHPLERTHATDACQKEVAEVS